jgi:phosphatidylglycerol lysyltransferase
MKRKMQKLVNFDENLWRKMGQKFNLEERLEYLKEHGRCCMAYSTLQQGMKYFDMPGIGYLAYVQYMGTRFVLSEPIAEGNKKGEIIAAALKKHSNTCFIQVQGETAKLLHKEFGFYGTPMGIETSLDIDDFESEWKTFNWVGRKIRKGEKKLKVYESTEVPQITPDQIAELSSQWLNHPKRRRRELAFLARPFQLNLPFTRTFYSFKDDRLVGVTVFDPMFHQGKIISYSVNITRTTNDAPDCTGDYSWYQALKTLKFEGCAELSLGLSPLKSLEQDRLDISDALTLKLLKCINRMGKPFYNFDGIHYHKKNFRGTEKSVYFCHRRPLAVAPVLKLLRICNII